MSSSCDGHVWSSLCLDKNVRFRKIRCIKKFCQMPYEFYSFSKPSETPVCVSVVRTTTLTTSCCNDLIHLRTNQNLPSNSWFCQSTCHIDDELSVGIFINHKYPIWCNVSNGCSNVVVFPFSVFSLGSRPHAVPYQLAAQQWRLSPHFHAFHCSSGKVAGTKNRL